MIGGQTVLAIIPARGGSKRLPGKNLKEVGGFSLVARAIRRAGESKYVDRVVVTTDDPAIAFEAMQRLAVVIDRPAELATDTATTESVVKHALDVSPRHDVFVLLQPTSPLRTAQDIDACIELVNEGEEAAVTVCFAPKPELVYWLSPTGEMELAKMGGRLSLATIQGEPVLLNGAVYCQRSEAFLRSGSFVPPGTVGHLMPRSRSIDIDTAEDLAAARAAVATPEIEKAA